MSKLAQPKQGSKVERPTQIKCSFCLRLLTLPTVILCLHQFPHHKSRNNQSSKNSFWVWLCSTTQISKIQKYLCINYAATESPMPCLHHWKAASCGNESAACFGSLQHRIVSPAMMSVTAVSYTSFHYSSALRLLVQNILPISMWSICNSLHLSLQVVFGSQVDISNYLCSIKLFFLIPFRFRCDYISYN